MCTGLGVLFHRVIGGLDPPIHSLYSPLRPWSSTALREREMLVARPGGSIHRFHPHFTIQNSVTWVHRISGECGKYNPILCPETKGAGLGASPQSSEKAMAPHSTLAWKIPWTEEPGRLQSMGSLRVGHDWATSLSLLLSCIGEGNGNPLQCYCLENPRDGVAWWVAVYGVTHSRTWLKWLSSSSLNVSGLNQNYSI